MYPLCKGVLLKGPKQGITYKDSSGWLRRMGHWASRIQTVRDSDGIPDQAWARGILSFNLFNSVRWRLMAMFYR